MAKRSDKLRGSLAKTTALAKRTRDAYIRSESLLTDMEARAQRGGRATGNPN